MTILFWSVAVVMLIVAVGFVAVPLKTGKPLRASPGILIAAFVPLSALGLYALLGAPRAVTAESNYNQAANGSSTSARSGQSARSLASVDSLVDGLESRLQDQPDDAGGWLLLARSYHHLNRHAEALDAYERAQALGKSDINLEASLFGPDLSGQMFAQPPGPVLRGRVVLSDDSGELEAWSNPVSPLVGGRIDLLIGGTDE